MSYQQIFTCDVCGAVRGPENHWWLARVVCAVIYFQTWNQRDAENAKATHLCGETCAATHLTRFIAKTREDVTA
jgi:hypothetical protein